MNLIKSDIIKIIEVKRKDTFVNHFSAIFKRDYSLAGEIGENEIKIWQLNIWNAVFYPIFVFKLNSKKEIVSITSKLNPFGKLSYLLLFISLNIFFTDFDYSKAKLSGIFFITTIYLTFISIFILLSFKIYNLEKKKQLKEIYKKLNKGLEIKSYSK